MNRKEGLMDLTLIRSRDPSRTDWDHMRTCEKSSIADVYHHGIKGMKWGVRHDRKRLGSASTTIEKSKTEGLQLTDKQKRALKIGAGAVVGVLAVYGGYKLNEMGAFNGLKQQSVSTPNKVDMSRVLGKNPYSSRGNNCGPAGMSGALQRAFGISSTPKNLSIPYAEFRPAMERCFKGCKVVEPFNSNAISSAEKASAFIKKRFAPNGEDGDGFLAFPVKSFSSTGKKLTHNISWQVRNGDVTFYDDGKQIEHARIVANHFKQIDVNRPFTAVRVTGSQVDRDELSKYVDFAREVANA